LLGETDRICQSFFNIVIPSFSITERLLHIYRKFMTSLSCKAHPSCPDGIRFAQPEWLP
jgi:hypothetical protein